LLKAKVFGVKIDLFAVKLYNRKSRINRKYRLKPLKKAKAFCFPDSPCIFSYIYYILKT